MAGSFSAANHVRIATVPMAHRQRLALFPTDDREDAHALSRLDRSNHVCEVTVIDHALTRPWSVTKKYRCAQVERPVWRETICAEHNQHVEIAKEGYMLSADGYLMPTRKDRPPPDLRYFKPTQK